MQTRYRDRGFMQRFPRDPHFHNETQYPQYHTPQNVYQNQRYSTRPNRHDSFQSINHRNRTPYNAPVRNQRIIRDSNYISNSLRPGFVDYYSTQLQQPQQHQFQNPINNSNIPNDSNNQNNNNNTNVGAHGLYEHLEVEKSMGVSPAPEIRVNNNLEESNNRKNKNNMINKTSVSSINNINNNINDNNTNQVHLVPLQTTRSNDNQTSTRSQDVRYTVNKDKTHLAHRPLPLPPGVYHNRQIVNQPRNNNTRNHNNNNNKDKRKYEERSFIQQYPNTPAYKQALQQSINRWQHQKQLQQATSYISQGGTSLAYDIVDDYQNNNTNNNNTNIVVNNNRKKSKSKKKSKSSNNTNNTTQIPQLVDPYQKYYHYYEPYSKAPKGYYSYDGNWYPVPNYPDPYMMSVYENKKSNQKSSRSKTSSNTKQNTEPEDKSRSVRKQVEFYFSDKNLKSDTFLKALMDKDGWVRASDIHAFPKLKRMGANSDMILEACKNSKQIQVRGRYIRKKDDWKKFLPDLNDTSKDTIKAIVTKIENIQKRIKNTQKAREKEEKKEQSENVNNNDNNDNSNNDDNKKNSDNTNSKDNNKDNDNNSNTTSKQNKNNENTTNNTETSSEFEKISQSTSQVQSLNTSFEKNDKTNDNTQTTTTTTATSASSEDDCEDDELILID